MLHDFDHDDDMTEEEAARLREEYNAELEFIAEMQAACEASPLVAVRAIDAQHHNGRDRLPTYLAYVCDDGQRNGERLVEISQFAYGNVFTFGSGDVAAHDGGYYAFETPVPVPAALLGVGQ
jgi:hypothetical protein